MGSGKRLAQVESRFGLGEEVQSHELLCSESISVEHVRIGDYDIEIGDNGYILRKGNEIIGTYKEAKTILEDRALFKLEKGMLLEVSATAVREILSPAKAGMIAFISSDGSLMYNTKRHKYQVRYGSSSDELLEKFQEFMNETYRVSMGKYPHKERRHFFELVKASKDIVRDLNEYTPKATGDWNVPFEYLDKESAMIFLKCFMSADGNIGLYPRSDHFRTLPLEVRFYSINRKGLEEIATLLKENFDICSCLYDSKDGTFRLAVETRRDKIRYIRGIGSFKKQHVEAIKRALEIVKEKRLDDESGSMER